MFSSRQIKEIIKDNNFRINKSFGQNFLIDKNIRDKMVALCRIEKDDTVLEIGPGLGALTEAILPLSKRLIAVEKDKGLSGFLESALTAESNFEIISKDILKYDITEVCRKKIKVIGNLPYYITTPVIFFLLKHREYIDSIYITVQKEVAERIVAKPSTKDYGLLSCSIQYYCQPKIYLNISKSCFFPCPQVDSAFLKLRIRKEPLVKTRDEDLLFKVIRSAFGQRRKTLFNALSKSPILRLEKVKLKKALDLSGLDPKVRGERLSIKEFRDLTEALL